MRKYSINAMGKETRKHSNIEIGNECEHAICGKKEIQMANKHM